MTPEKSLSMHALHRLYCFGLNHALEAFVLRIQKVESSRLGDLEFMINVRVRKQEMESFGCE